MRSFINKSNERESYDRYSDDELTLWFNNDGSLYNLINEADCFEELKGIVDELFIYTPDQLAELKKEFDEDLN